jgi:DeoR/GlpR family transcriptional regulator of sugar metabolism
MKSKAEKHSKSKRRDLILLELKLRPHVRILELAKYFGVSTETIRRDVDALSRKGLVGRAHGGATAAAGVSTYPDFDARNQERLAERERIGRAAAALVTPGASIMIDSGATTYQMARFLAYQGTPCTVITNSLSIAMKLGQSDAADVIVCPGNYLRSETAVTGPQTLKFIGTFKADACFLGASGLDSGGPMEAIRDFAAVKTAMMERCSESHLLIDGEKFGQNALVCFAPLQAFSSLVTDARPEGELGTAVATAGTRVHLAEV